jgi:TRAP-type C4-dicarboxylate transport system substrate-binding protein
MLSREQNQEETNMHAKTASLILAGALLAGAGGAPRTAAAQTILFNCFFPPQHYTCRVMLHDWAKQIEKATDGRVKFTIPPKSLAAPEDQYDGVVNGVMDGALQFNQFLSNRVTGIQVGQLPFIGTESAESGSVALWRTYQKFFAAKDEYGPVKLLADYATNGAEFWSMNDQPIRSIEDLKNRKMWALPGVSANIVKATGSAVVAGPAVQMLEIISKGVVDGYVGVPYSSVVSFKLLDYTKSATIFPDKIFTPTFSFFISRKKWDTISPADRAAIEALSGEKISRYFGQVQDAVQKQAKADVLKHGIKAYAGDPAMLAKLEALGQPMTDAWLKKTAAMGVDGKAVIAYYRKVLAEEDARRK